MESPRDTVTTPQLAHIIPTTSPSFTPLRLVFPGEGDWSYSADRYAYERVTRRIVLAGESPTRGGLRNSPPVPMHIRISPLKLPIPPVRQQSTHDPHASRIPVSKVKRPSFLVCLFLHGGQSRSLT
ncbi:hypothetical protein CPB83DRAFT_449467 [Crepidotus variabilis]|uniref:Uncharacterized protein n=1 Tax=Crepidotus variabilis TaxID=179855 RepID=A0A9P6ECQ2_9AGAR|nr:hypothetical protein CPB83DRAFT_449467 [Crepidotus variabilis]